MKVVFAERARRDIESIHDSIALHDRAAAQRVEDAIRELCEQLGRFPYASAATDEPNVRRVPLVHYDFTIFFRIDTSRHQVQIARVVRSARVRSLRRMTKGR